ncbi:L-histidine N(alpha)-methyltransferase, partial [bacterium]|nr:L-histidine N(alpha)-methyltransferase [bacterium]
MKKELVFKKERIEIRSHLASSYDRLIKNDVSHGLGLEKKSLPSKYFYDSRGSRLFEKICALPEYYPTRTEMSILREAAPQIMEDFTSGDIVELGSGANWKVRMLLDAAGQERLKDLRYVPVDVSESALQDASEELLRIYPELEVLGIIADFTVHMDLIPSERPRLMVFLGSTIGNFDERARRDFLKGAAAAMKPEDRFLIGFDMVKSRDTLEAAYNDEQGVTSEFNKNVLHVL